MKARIGIVSEVRLHKGVVRLVRDITGNGHYLSDLPPKGTRGVIVCTGLGKIFYAEIQSNRSASGRV